MITGNEPQLSDHTRNTDHDLKMAEATRLIADLMSIIHRPAYDQTSDVVSIKNQARKWITDHSK